MSGSGDCDYEDPESKPLTGSPESDDPVHCMRMCTPSYELGPDSITKLACEGRPLKLKRKIESMKKDINDLTKERDRDGLTALHFAARYNRLICMKLLIDEGGFDINVEDNSKMTPLHHAVRYRCQRSLERGLDEGDDQLNCETTEDFDRIILPETEEPSPPHLVISYLIKRGAKVGHKDMNGCTPLHYAAMRGNEIAAYILILHQPDLRREQDAECQLPLHLACQHNQLDIVQILLTWDSDYEDLLKEDFAANTPLLLACSAGHLDIVSFLLKEVVSKKKDMVRQLLGQCDMFEASPLIVGVESGVIDLVQLLIDHGADVNCTNWRLQTALHRASYNGDTRMMQLLLDHGARVDAMDSHSETPLHLAAANDKPEAVQLLIDNGADVSNYNEIRLTPLFVAVQYASLASIDVFLTNKVSPLGYDLNGKSILHLAVEDDCHEAIAKLLNLEQEREKLLAATDRNNNTPLHDACFHGAVQSVKLLLENGLSLTAINEDEYTPLHFAAQRGHTQIVKLLCAKQSSSKVLNALDCDNNTPLHMAATEGHMSTVRILVDAGADVGRKNRDTWTALDCAADGGFVDIVSFLLEEGNMCVEPTDLSPRATPLYLACCNGHVDVVNLLLENRADPSKRVRTTGKSNAHFTNPLNAAIDNGHKSCVRAILNSYEWRSAMQQCKVIPEAKGAIDTPMRKLIRKMPDMASLVFDKCLESSKDVPISHREHTVTLNYEFLDDTHTSWVKSAKGQYRAIEEADDDEPKVKIQSRFKGWLGRKFHSDSTDARVVKNNHPLMEMVKCERHELLAHPLVVCLLESKWKSFGRNLYYFNLFVYLTFLAAFTLYILSFPKDDKESCSFGTSFNATSSVSLLENKIFIRALQYSIYALAGIGLIKELVQIATSKWNYFELENLVEWTIYVGSTLSAVDFNECQQYTGMRFAWQQSLASVVIFLAWLNLVLFIKKVPRFGIYVLMFTDILSTFIQFSCVFILFILAFGFGFYTILSNQTPFRTWPQALLKISVMMTGEFDFESMFNARVSEPTAANSINFPAVTYILFVVFLVVMSILLMNLLVGLAVDDTQSIMRKAQLRRYAMQIELVLGMESMMPILSRGEHSLTQTIYPNRKRPASMRLFSLTSSDGRNALIEYEMNQDDADEMLTETQEQTSNSIRKMERSLNQMRSENVELKRILHAISKKLEVPLDFSDDNDFAD